MALFLSTTAFAQTTLSATAKLKSVVGNTYTYTVADSDAALSCGGFNVQLGAAISNVKCPAGWDYDTDYATYIVWFATDTAGTTAFIAPKKSATFSFDAEGSTKQSPFSYYVLGINPTSGASGVYAVGTVNAPLSCPGVASVSINGPCLGLTDITGTVTLGAPAHGGYGVAITSSKSVLQVPTMVYFNEGDISETFNVFLSEVSSDTPVIVKATSELNAQSTTVTVTQNPLVLSIGGPTVPLDSQVPAAILLKSNAAVPRDIVIALKSSNPALVSVPATVTWPATSAQSPDLGIQVGHSDTVQAVLISATIGTQTLTARLTVTPPALLALTMSPATVAGGTVGTGTVKLASPAPAEGLTVALASNSALAAVPATIQIPGGATSATFSVATTAPNTTTAVTITATGNGSHTAKLTILGPTVSAVSISPTSVVGGADAIGTVTLTTAAPGAGLTVALSSNAGFASVPGAVTVPAGSLTATFAIATSPVAANSVATITASVNGASKPKTLLVKAPVLNAISLTPNPVVGGSNATGTVTLSSAAPVGGISIALTSDSSVAGVPVTVVVPQGATTGTFTITTTAVTSNTAVTVSAASNGLTKIKTFTVKPH